MSPRGRPSRKQCERSEEKRRAQTAQASAGAPVRRLRLEAKDAGERLDLVLARELPELSRGQLQRLFAQGLVRAGGVPALAAARLAAGTELELPLLPELIKLPPVELSLTLLYRDECLLIVDKPAGLSMHPGPGVDGPTLLHGLLSLHARPGLAHRLDKETSGCVAVALSVPALRALQAAFKSRAVEKRYLALVHGAPPDTGRFETLHGPHPEAPRRFSTRVAAGARAATGYRVLGRAQGCALVEVELFTGRTHQIRAHFADAGFPLLGDVLYGGRAAEALLPEDAPARRASAALGRLALHAHRLSFAHPVTAAPLSFAAPVPADLRAALALLGLDGQVPA